MPALPKEQPSPGATRSIHRDLEALPDQRQGAADPDDAGYAGAGGEAVMEISGLQSLTMAEG